MFRTTLDLTMVLKLVLGHCHLLISMPNLVKTIGSYN